MERVRLLVLTYKTSESVKFYRKYGELWLLYDCFIAFYLKNFVFPDEKWADGWGEGLHVDSYGSLKQAVPDAEDYHVIVCYYAVEKKGRLLAYSNKDVAEAYRQGKVLQMHPKDYELPFLVYAKLIQVFDKRHEKARELIRKLDELLK